METNPDLDRLNALTDAVPCPVCGASDPGWHELNYGAGEGATDAHAAIHANDPPHKAPAIAVACQRCGFVRLHALAIVRGDF